MIHCGIMIDFVSLSKPSIDDRDDKQREQQGNQPGRCQRDQIPDHCQQDFNRKPNDGVMQGQQDDHDAQAHKEDQDEPSRDVGRRASLTTWTDGKVVDVAL